MKEDYQIIIAILFGVCATVIVGILLVRFGMWVFEDTGSKQIEIKKRNDDPVWIFQRDECVKKGGIPIQSGWDWQLKECKGI